MQGVSLWNTLVWAECKEWWETRGKSRGRARLKLPTKEFKPCMWERVSGYDKPMNQVCLGWRYQEIQGK